MYHEVIPTGELIFFVHSWQARDFDGNVYELRDQLRSFEQEMKSLTGVPQPSLAPPTLHSSLVQPPVNACQCWSVKSIVTAVKRL